MRRRSLAVAACLAGLAIPAACGDDSSSSGSASAATAKASDIGKADFIKQADAACQEFDATLAKAAAKLPEDPSTDDLVKLYRDSYVPAYRKQLADIAAIGFPKADKATLDKLLADAEKELAKVEKDPVAAAQDDAAFSAIDKRFADYGFTVCGNTQ